MLRPQQSGVDWTYYLDMQFKYVLWDSTKSNHDFFYDLEGRVGLTPRKYDDIAI